MRVTRDVPVTGRLCLRVLLGMLTSHLVPGAERLDPDTARLTRLVSVAGRSWPVTVVAEDHRVRVSADSEVVEQVVELVSTWWDLRTDTAVHERAWRDDPVLGRLVRARPGVRLLRHLDPYEGLILTVLGQQVSLAAARVLIGRLVASYGEPGPAGLRRFPTAHRLATVDIADLRATAGLTWARASTVQAVSQAWRDGLDLRGNAISVRARLLALPGIGPWTADQLAIRALGQADAFSPGDLVLRRALGGCTAAEALQRAEAWRPWRAYAMFHLWAAEVFDPDPVDEPTPA